MALPRKQGKDNTMTLQQYYIGVDIAKDWIDIYHPDTNQYQQVKTTPQHLHVFAKTCKNALIVFEVSGGYERPLMNALEKLGVDYVRVNPRQAREFARATGQLAKTDQVDAKMLAHMGRALELQADTPTDHARLRLSALTARRDALVEHKKQEQNRLTQTTDAFVKSDSTSFMKDIKRRIKKLEVEIETHIKTHKQLARLDRQLRSALGVAPITEAEKEDLFELLEARTDVGSTLITGQLSPSEWYNYLAAGYLADAIMDRIIQRSHSIELKGKPLRTRLTL